jgi:hypothetical protein
VAVPLRNLRGNPTPKPVEEMGVKEIGRQGLILAEAALKVAGEQLAETKETNRLLAELLKRGG